MLVEWGEWGLYLVSGQQLAGYANQVRFGQDSQGA